jgi:hypothetical protein
MITLRKSRLNDHLTSQKKSACFEQEICWRLITRERGHNKMNSVIRVAVLFSLAISKILFSPSTRSSSHFLFSFLLSPSNSFAFDPGFISFRFSLFFSFLFLCCRRPENQEKKKERGRKDLLPTFGTPVIGPKLVGFLVGFEQNNMMKRDISTTSSRHFSIYLPRHCQPTFKPIHLP